MTFRLLTLGWYAFLTLLFGGALYAGIFLGNRVVAPHSEVLVFNCIEPGGDRAQFLHEGSSGAPAVTAHSCAQGLAEANNAGFTLSSVLVADSSAPKSVVYTLTRGAK